MPLESCLKLQNEFSASTLSELFRENQHGGGYRTRLIHNGITHNGLSKAVLGVPIFVWFPRSMSAECVLKNVEYKQLSFSGFRPTNGSIVFEHFP